MLVKFYEAFAEEEQLLKETLPKNIAAEFTAATIQESGDTHPPTSLISIRTQSLIPPEWGQQLDGVLTRSVGYDHLAAYREKTAAGAKDLACGYLPDYCYRAVAEQALLLIMAIRRKLPRQTAQMLSFNRDHLTGQECLAAKLLVLGVGRIGSAVVDLSRALGMAARGVDIDPRRADLEYCALPDGLAWADILVCALPLTDLTRDMVTAQVLSAARPGLVVVNVGRGEVTPLADLVAALDAGHLAGVGLDVYPQEDELAATLRAGEESAATRLLNKLAAEDRVILTPHNAFNTTAAVERKAQQSIRGVVAFLQDQRFPNPIPSP